MASIEEIEKFFFRASTMRQNDELKDLPDDKLPGSRLRVYQENNLRFSHLQFRGAVSGWGTIFIHEGETLRWYSDSRGTCKSREAVDFLAAALTEAYLYENFLAGRGPLRFTSPRFPGFEYINKIEAKYFRNFSCIERVIKGGEEQCIHIVRGGII